MTAGQQHITWIKFNSFQRKIENKYIPLVLAPMQKVVNDFADAGFPPAKINDYIKLAGPLIPIINNLYYECATGYGGNVYRQFGNLKGISPIAAIAQKVINTLRISLLQNVHRIEESIKNAILSIIQDGLNNGWAYEKTAKAIKGVPDIVRSRRIVRTESVKAANLAAIEAARQKGFLMDKIWISAKDKRVRGNPSGNYPLSEFDHFDMNGQTIPIDNKFFLGGRNGGSDELDYPGDPAGNPADIINCRCVLGFIPKRDDNGRLIRTSQIINNFAQ